MAINTTVHYNRRGSLLLKKNLMLIVSPNMGHCALTEGTYRELCCCMHIHYLKTVLIKMRLRNARRNCHVLQILYKVQNTMQLMKSSVTEEGLFRCEYSIFTSIIQLPLLLRH